MMVSYLKSKIHRAIVTQSDIHYEGSLGIDENLMKAAGMREFEKVEIYNVSNGERFSTYLIKEEAGSGQIGVYGAAAHKAKPGDVIIITSYCLLTEEEVEFHLPKIVLLDGNNKIKLVKN
ncbi:MAG: aspartate 1-decarboxylase [Candidatus Saccharicenans sp.]|nr:MAG: aspartate 1-decarboxylase [Candidatus Aminicenantes bacterium]HEK86791.1 aspartate 1-decarboxylase [Candidatus Aminicenantes bacterium]